jgi:hypothetical protein
VLGDDIVRMIETLERDLRGLRDRAILLLGFAGGFRAARSSVSIAAGIRARTAGLDRNPKAQPRRHKRERLDR